NRIRSLVHTLKEFIEMKLIKSLVLFVGLIKIALCQYPQPNPCTGACNTHDPSVIRRSSDGAYFRFSTNGRVGTDTAPSLSGPWRYVGPAFNRAPIMPQ